MPTNQETFDIVVAHARKQGKKALAEDGQNCLYKAPDGSMCFAGCLIPEDKYHPFFEGNSVVGLAGAIDKVIEEEEEHDLSLVSTLQDIHDDFAVEEWEEQFHRTADTFSLSYTPPVETE